MSPYRTLRRTQIFVALMMILSMIVGSPITQAQATGSIAAFKFYDTNQNGLWDPGESPIRDWQLCIGGVCQNTNSGGFVTRSGLGLDTSYAISETLPAGWATQSDNPQWYAMRLGASTWGAPGPASTVLNVGGATYTVTLQSQVGNTWTYGVTASGSPGLSHWLLGLGGCLDNVTATSPTASDIGRDGSTGYYGVKWDVSNFISGTFVVTMDGNYPRGTIEVVTKGGPGFAAGTIAGPICTIFGNYRTDYSISGAKWNDLNGDGDWDTPGESGLPDWTIQLWQGGSVISTTVTAGDGSYSFDNLVAGTYTVTEVLKDGWRQTAPAGGEHVVTLPADTQDGSITGQDFGNQQLGGLTVTKVVDWNGVTPDPSQAFTITITGPSHLGGNSQSIDYDGGAASWSGLVPGVYTVTETSPGSEWTVTPGLSQQVTVTGGLTATATITNTRVQRPGTITIIKDAGGDTAAEFGFTLDYADVMPAAVANATLPVTFTLEGGESETFELEPGVYSIVESSLPDGWVLVDIECVVEGDNNDVEAFNFYDVPNGTIQYLGEGQSVVCTFYNRKPGLDIVKSVMPENAAPNDTVVYTITYTNTGTMDLTGVTITDDPNELYVDSIDNISDGGGYAAGQITWSIGDLAAGETGSVTYEATLKDEEAFALGQTLVDNIAVIDSDQVGPAQDEATVVVTRLQVPVPGTITIIKDAGGDTTAEFGFTLDYADVMLKAVANATLPVTFTLVGGESAVFELEPGWYSIVESSLPDGWVLTDIQCVVEGDNNDVEALQINGVLNGTTEYLGEGWSVTCTFYNRKPGLDIVKSVMPENAAPNDTVVYTIAYSNTGTMDLTGVSITDTPDWAHVASALANATTYTSGDIVWAIGDLAAGAGGSVTYQATLKGEEAFALDQTLVDNVAVINSDQVGPVQDEATVIVTRLVAPAPGLTIDKVGSTTTARIGDTVAYTITVRNTGNITLTNVTIVDAKLGINQNLGDLAPGASAQVTGSYLVTEADLDGIVNTAVADADEVEPVEDTWTVVVAAQPGLVIVKTVSTPRAEVGDLITFTLTVTNTGDVALKDVTIVDELLGVSENVGDLAVGQSKSIQVPYTVVEADIEGIHNVAVATGRDPEGEVVSDDDEAVVIVDREYEQPPTPVPCVRADVAVVIYGGWNGIPVKAWVGGTEQQTLRTALDAFGQQQVMWTLYPPENTSWSVAVQPQTPEGKDPARWQYRLVRIESPSLGTVNNNPGSASVSITRCNQYVLYFQLVDLGATPAVAPTPPSQPRLPVTGSGPEPILAGGLGLFAALSGLGWSLRRRKGQ